MWLMQIHDVPHCHRALSYAVPYAMCKGAILVHLRTRLHVHSYNTASFIAMKLKELTHFCTAVTWSLYVHMKILRPKIGTLWIIRYCTLAGGFKVQRGEGRRTHTHKHTHTDTHTHRHTHRTQNM